MLEFAPEKNVDTTYDSVAMLYDETFADIGVRADEWNWLMKSRGALAGKMFSTSVAVTVRFFTSLRR